MTRSGLVLLPAPKSVEPLAGTFRLPDHAFIRIEGAVQDLLPAARAIRDAVGASSGRRWHIAAGGPASGTALYLRLDTRLGRAEGYVLTVQPASVTIEAADAAGAFYGAMTLKQILRQHTLELPALRIEDWPDFPNRGVMLDISRSKVPTLATLECLVDRLAEWKINQIQLYTEHTFAYRGHPEVWAEASPITGEEILHLDAWCRRRFVELVPNQNSFGHMERWLRLPRYRPLAEAPEGFDLPWGGRMEHPFSLCPIDPGSLQLLESLYDELLPHFTSQKFNVGCDETWDLGQGRSAAECRARGRERVYLDFVLSIYRLVQRYGRTMQFWGDIILHRPDLIRDLPKDVVALEWGYEAGHPFEKDAQLFADAGVGFYVCPGTSSWNSILGRAANALANIENAARNGIANGASGLLVTDWGDNGHLQYQPVSYPGFAAAAQYAWNAAGAERTDLSMALAMHAFEDAALVMGEVVLNLGNAYQAMNMPMENASPLFHPLVHPLDAPPPEGVTAEGVEKAAASISGALDRLGCARMRIPDAQIVADELRNAAAMALMACSLYRYKLGVAAEGAAELSARLRAILGEHRRLWMARNREGGLHESTRALEARLRELEGAADHGN
ncbi:MAG: glycoside hydrolase family 20 zincin-like fold domain-containing protein [Chthonomonadales bacterium]